MDTGITRQPPVRVEIREDRTTIADVRHVAFWPPPDIGWQTLHGHAGAGRRAGGLEPAPAAAAETVELGHRGGRASFRYRFATDTDVVGRWC